MVRHWNELPMVMLAEHVCEVLTISRKTLRRRLIAETMLDPIDSEEKCKRWYRDEFKAWIEAGCPPMSIWRRKRRRPGDGDEPRARAG